MSSFARQLNGYGFSKIKIGPYERSYYHPLFLRNLPHLTKSIKRSGNFVKSIEGQSILSEIQLERVSAERPLPEKMNPSYENHIKTMNRYAYEGYGVAKLQEQDEAEQEQAESPQPAAAAPSPVEAVPSVIYTPSPNPLPTPLQQLSPASGQQGTVFTQTHLPLTEVAGTSPQTALSPTQELFLSFQQQPINVPASSVTQEMPGAANQYAAASQSAQAQVAVMAEEVRRNAQIQLLVNALSAAATNGQVLTAAANNSQVFLPLTIPGIVPQVATQPSPAPQLNANLQQQINASYGTSPLDPPTDPQQNYQQQPQQQQSSIDTSQLSVTDQQAFQPGFAFGTSQLINQDQTGLYTELSSLQQYQAAMNAQQQQCQVMPNQPSQVSQTFSILDPSQLVSQSYGFYEQPGSSVQPLPAAYQQQQPQYKQTSDV